jgi:hypothetical protein
LKCIAHSRRESQPTFFGIAAGVAAYPPYRPAVCSGGDSTFFKFSAVGPLDLKPHSIPTFAQRGDISDPDLTDAKSLIGSNSAERFDVSLVLIVANELNG